MIWILSYCGGSVLGGEGGKRLGSPRLEGSGSCGGHLLRIDKQVAEQGCECPAEGQSMGGIVPDSIIQVSLESWKCK